MNSEIFSKSVLLEEIEKPHEAHRPATKRAGATRLTDLPELKLDRNFGNQGKVVFDALQGRLTRASAVYRHGDWVFVLAYQSGTADNAYALIKIDKNGKLDPSFGSDGYVPFELLPGRAHMPSTLVVLGDGSGSPDTGFFIVAQRFTESSADYELTLAKLLADGRPDPNFGNNGIVDFSALVPFNKGFDDVWPFLGNDQKIYLVIRELRGSAYHSYVAKLTESGGLDPSFHEIGYYEIGPSSTHGMYISEPKINALGQFQSFGYTNDGIEFLIRFTRKWDLDPAYGEGGLQALPISASIVEPSVAVVKENLLAAGADSRDENRRNPRLVKYEIDGKLAADFNSGQPVTTPVPGIDFALWESVDVLSDGSILCIGTVVDYSGNFLVARILAHFTSSGELDAGYGEGKGIEIVNLRVPSVSPKVIFDDHRLLWSGIDFGLDDKNHAVVYGFKI